MVRITLASGTTVELDSTEEAVKFLRQFEGENRRPIYVTSGLAPLPTPTEAPPEPPARALAVRFLETVVASGTGVSSREIATRLHLTNTTALGPITRGIGTRLTELGFDVDSVYRRRWESNESFWSPGPNAEEALRRLKESSNSHQ